MPSTQSSLLFLLVMTAWELFSLSLAYALVKHWEKASEKCRPSLFSPHIVLFASLQFFPAKFFTALGHLQYKAQSLPLHPPVSSHTQALLLPSPAWMPAHPAHWQCFQGPSSLCILCWRCFLCEEAPSSLIWQFVLWLWLICLLTWGSATLWMEPPALSTGTEEYKAHLTVTVDA